MEDGGSPMPETRNSNPCFVSIVSRAPEREETKKGILRGSGRRPPLPSPIMAKPSTNSRGSHSFEENRETVPGPKSPFVILS